MDAQAVKTIESNPRAGIALVMTLGILSLMVLMAVSFAISMRTERMAAGNYLDTVQARQLAQTALARAMEDIASNCPSLADNATNSSPYPDWSVLLSEPITNYDGSLTNDFLKGSASNFVPRALWEAATNHNEVTNCWIRIRTDALIHEANANVTTNRATNLMGRVAYMILNCSGLIDANFAGGDGVEHTSGTNPIELGISSLPEVGSGFFSRREDDIRYETLEELSRGGLNPSASNLFIYSRAPAGYWDTNAVSSFVGAQVNLAGGVSELENREGYIIAGLTNCGFNPSQAGILYSNLLDYVDSDSQLRVQNLETAVEAVPMINEIMVHITNATANDVEGRVTFELWFPFVNNDVGSQNFSLKTEVDFGNGLQIPETDLYVTGIEPGTFTNIEFATLMPVSMDPLPTALTPNIQRAQVFLGGDLVDEVSGFTFDPVNLNDSLSIECVDPRFNRDAMNRDRWQYLAAGTDTLGTTNQATLDHWAANPDCDTDGRMYVKNGPLKSVGELGYLAYAPWQTIKLYGPNAHPVMDYFAVGTNESDDFVTNTIWRGRVNPNAFEAEALATVFASMHVNEMPGQSVSDTVSWPEALDTADFIISSATNGFYTNLSDMCRIDWDSHFNNVFPSTADNELKREAFIRNTVGLLSTRGQMFTILIEAHVASGGIIPKRPSRQRAVAVVWRDAWTGAMFVRYFKWLSD